VREYTPENESFREDAIAVINGSAVVVAVMGFWTTPLFMGPIALAVAALGWVLSPRARGGTIVAVAVLSVLALLVRWVWGYSY
jgi:hypothetical protein